MSRIHTPNLCLRCWHYLHGKCVKGPNDYCKITRTNNPINTRKMATNVQVRQDWDNDGFLRITGAETLQRYSELCQQKNNIPIDKYGVFFAFDQGQFDNGYKGLVKMGFIKDGEKVKSFGQGCFGILDGMKRWVKECREIDDKIRAECDPYEVYLYEYNNFECCIDWDGDTRAVEKVISLFGASGAAAIQGRRMRAIETVDTIEENMNK